MEGKTLVLIQALGRNNDGKVSTVTALLLDELSNTTSTVNLSVDEFKKSAEGALALESYLHNDPNPNPSKGSNNKPCNDTRSNDTHLNPGNNADEELDRMLYKPIYLALINAPQCTKIAIEALIGAPIEDLDTSTTLSNKSTVNWLHFSVKGLQNAKKSIQKVEDNHTNTKLLYRYLHNGQDKIRCAYLKGLPIAESFQEVNEVKAAIHVAMMEFGKLIDVSFWMEQDTGSVIFESLDVIEKLPDNFTITVNDFAVAVTKNQIIRLTEPHDLVIGGFSDMDKIPVLNLITKEVGPLTHHRFISKGGKPFLVVTTERYAAARELYNRDQPLIYAKEHSRMEFILTFDWAIDFNTSGPTASKAIVSPNKGARRGMNNAQLSSMQNQLRLLQEIRAQDSDKIITKMDTNLATQWRRTLQLISQSQEHNQRVLCSTVTQVTNRVNVLHRQTQRENNKQMALQIKSWQLLFFQASADPSLRNQCSEIKKEIETLQIDLNALEEQTNQILSEDIVIPADPGAFQHLPSPSIPAATVVLEDDDAFLDNPTFIPSNSKTTSKPIPHAATAEQEEEEVDLIEENPVTNKVNRIAKRIEITPDHDRFNKWQRQEKAGMDRFSLLREEWESEVAPLLEMHIYRSEGYWLFTEVTTEEQKLEVLTILQTYVTYFRGTKTVRSATEILKELAPPVLAELKNRRKQEAKQWKAKLEEQKEAERAEKETELLDDLDAPDAANPPLTKKARRGKPPTDNSKKVKTPTKAERNKLKKAKRAAAKKSATKSG